MSARRFPTAAVLALVLVAAACGGGADSSDGADDSTPTTVVPGCNAERPVDPVLPADVNAIPYLRSDNVALGDWKVRIEGLVDPWTKGPAAPEGSRNVALDLELENGSLEPQRIEPDVLFLYDTRGCGTNPVATETTPALGRPLASAAVAQARVIFAVPIDRDPSVLLFRGTETYGPKVLNGLIALDPDYRPPEANS